MHKAFFGDRDRDFALTPQMIPELERTARKGIVAMVHNVRQASLVEITETIRLALVGAGTAPEEAAVLVSTYVPVRPLGEAHILAIDILNDLWNGSEAAPVEEVA